MSRVEEPTEPGEGPLPSRSPKPRPPRGEGDEARRPRPGRRLLAVAVAVLALLLVARLSGLADRSPEVLVGELRALVLSWGAGGALLFVVLFAVGELLQIPGLVFVAAAVLSYGRLHGGLLAYFAGLVSVSVSFAVFRALGGAALADLERPWLRKVLGRLRERPVRTIATLRAVLLLSPPLNAALALSRVRFRDYLAGSALGLLPPVAGFVLLFERCLLWLGWAL